MKISVIGTGYVGLVTGTCFAEVGHKVCCVDIDADKVFGMQHGEVPIYEPQLDELFRRNIDQKRLSFTIDLNSGIADADVIFLALPTPSGADGSADLSAILSVASELGPLLKHPVVIVNKSTVPVGTAEKVKECISKNTTVSFDVVSNPEFLREGMAVDDFMRPDRIVVGAPEGKAREIMHKLYEPFIDGSRPIFFMDERSAEMTKYASNAFLATKVAFINEIANLSDLVGADVESVRHAIGADPRIGTRFLQPGIGYGGSCFPKDVKALSKTAHDYGYAFQTLKSVMNVNQIQHQVLVKKITDHFGQDLSGKTFAMWGLAFKPDTDDIREAPSLRIVDDLLRLGARITAYDPKANDNVRKQYIDQTELIVCNDQYEATEGADALLVTTEWNQFKDPDFTKLKQLLKNQIIFDGRNIYQPQQLSDYGFDYVCIGRPNTKAIKEDFTDEYTNLESLEAFPQVVNI